MPKYLTVSEAATLKRVSPDILRRCERKGKISSVRTDGGHRRYLASDLILIEESDDKSTVCYPRVSTRDRKDCLETQANVLLGYAESQGWKNNPVSRQAQKLVLENREDL